MPPVHPASSPALTGRLQAQGIGVLPAGSAQAVMQDLMLDVPGALVTISLFTMPVPEHETEAAAQYARWDGAQTAAQSHKAHLMIAVMPDRMSAADAGRLYCTIMAAALDDAGALAVYTSGSVMEPSQFCARTAGDDPQLLVENLVVIRTYTRPGGNCGYTIGMDAFGKDELEVLDCTESIETIAHVLKQCVLHILDADSPSGWYLTITIDGRQWEGRRKDGVMVEGHSLQLCIQTESHI